MECVGLGGLRSVECPVVFWGCPYADRCADCGETSGCGWKDLKSSCEQRSLRFPRLRSEQALRLRAQAALLVIDPLGATLPRHAGAGRMTAFRGRGNLAEGSLKEETIKKVTSFPNEQIASRG